MSVDERVAAPVRRLNAELALGLGVFGASLTLLLIRFLVPRPVSLSDNGDGLRVLCAVGITWKSKSEPFMRLSWDVAPDGCRSTYAMTQNWFARLASALGHAIGLETTLSIVVLGIIGCVVAAAAVALLVLGLPYGRGVRLLVGAGVLLVVADSAFFGYFSSLFGEGPAFLGLVLIAGGLLLTARPGRWSYAGIAVTFVGGLLAINAKGQMLTVLPLLAVAVLLIRTGGHRGRKRWIPSTALVLALGLSTVLVWQTVDPAMNDSGVESRVPGAQFEETNVANAVFLIIVDGKHDSIADLDALGLPRSFAKYAGQNWWVEHPVREDPLFLEVHSQFNRANLLNYYLHHRGRAMEVLQQAAQDQLTARPEYLASFDASAGFAPREQEYRVPVVSWLTGLIAPLGLFALIPLWLVLLARIWWQRRTPLGVVLGFLLAVSTSQYLTAALGDGIEGIKHQVVALFALLIALVLAIPFRQFWPSEPRCGTNSSVTGPSLPG